MSQIAPLPTEALFRRCEPESFDFETTAELADLADPVGQDRAVDAIRFGIGIRRPGYNLFALGPYGSGKHSTIQRLIRDQAAGEPTPSDWCYVHNFDDPHCPRALSLPPGRGAELRADVAAVLDDLRTVVPAALATEEYRTRKLAIEEDLKARQARAFSELEERARNRGVAFLRSPVGFVFAPIAQDRVIGPDDFEKLPKERRRQLESAIDGLKADLHALVHDIPLWEQEARERGRALNREIVGRAVGHLFERLTERYKDLPDVVGHLKAVKEDLVANSEAFLAGEEGSPLAILQLLDPHREEGRRDVPTLRRYRINLLVTRARDSGAPVVSEEFPSYRNLLGGVEHVTQMGTLLTDFSLIRGGALHKANGGYLVLDARKVLLQPYAWEGLKQALQSGRVRIESVSQFLGLAGSVTLDPAPIPLDVKVVLVGDRMLYYLLCELDPEFNELFKVAADFDDRMPRDEATNRLYAKLVATLARKEGLLPFDRSGVARVVEHASRLAGDSERVSTRIGLVVDLLREADFWARRNGGAAVDAASVKLALEAGERRANRLHERLIEETRRGTILIDTDGLRVGQVNGLSAVEAGRHVFGHPSRISASVRMGKGEVVDIEREVEMGGPIHSKGVLILSGFLGAKFARKNPLALSASLVFEQTYAGVEGDSASLAELCALLSALSEAPVRQGFAVTGSVNQLGQVQAIGAVNQKIEGFFELCRARGLTGEQGVIIPAANAKDLMLREEVVAAVADGRFRVFAVRNVDEAIEILTGIEAGQREISGAFPHGSVNARVEAKLAEYAETQRAFESPPPAESFAIARGAE